MATDSPGSPDPGEALPRLAGAGAGAGRPARQVRVPRRAATVRDGEARRRLVEAAGIRCEVFPDLDRLCVALDDGAAAAVVPEEAVLADDGHLLACIVARQP